MDSLFGGDIHAGLSGLELEEESFDLGDGLTLSKTYAHLMSPFVMAFKPAPPGGHHPAPWKAAAGGFSFDIGAELFVPSRVEAKYGSVIGVARTVVFLLRLGVNPAVTMPVLSDHPFSSLPETPDRQANLLPYEVERRHFPLDVSGGKGTATALGWVKERWPVTHKLTSESAEFALAVEAIDAGQFVRNSALALVSLWGALEALFSPSTTELKFRVSSLIAAFLESPGDGRARLQKEVARLYDKRSAAAHGKPKHEPQDLLGTFNLLRQILITIIDRRSVPSKDALEGMLFGLEPED